MVTSRAKVALIRSRAIDPNVNKIARTLSQNGYDVKLLVWNRQNVVEGEQGKTYSIHRFCLKAPYDKLVTLFFLPIWWIFEFSFLLRTDMDVIHACDLDTLLPAVLAKFIKKAKLCYTIYDFYADNLPDGRSTIRRIIRGLVARAERFWIGFADLLLLADEFRIEEVRGAKINDLVYIYNSPADCLDPTKCNRTTKPAKGITIFYAGLISRQRGLQYIISAVRGLRDVELIIAGNVTDKELVDKSYTRSERIRYIGWLPSYDEVIQNTLNSDVLFRFSDPRMPNQTKYESPNKLFEAMMCKKPIIVSDGSRMAEIVREVNCGLVLPYGDVEAIKAAIVKLKTNPRLREELGENGRKAYEKYYSWSIMESRLIDAYSRLRACAR